MLDVWKGRVSVACRLKVLCKYLVEYESSEMFFSEVKSSNIQDFSEVDKLYPHIQFLFKKWNLSYNLCSITPTEVKNVRSFKFQHNRKKAFCQFSGKKNIPEICTQLERHAILEIYK